MKGKYAKGDVMIKYVVIGDVCFICNLDEEVVAKFCDNIDTQTFYNDSCAYNIDLVCIKKDKINFQDTDFMMRQEPKYTPNGLFREIFDLGTFSYLRVSKKIIIEYMIDDNYPLDPYEILVDTILQFMYLTMIDYDMLPIHASVVNYKGKGIAIFGNSGMGKTTLQLALLNNGGKFFADDCAFLDNSVNIYSDRGKKISYTHNTCNIINLCYNTELKTAGKYKSYIMPELTDCKCLSLVGMVFPCQNIGKNEYSIKRLSPKTVLNKLVKCHVSNEYRVEEKQMYWNRFIKLSKCCPAYLFEWSGVFDALEYISAINMLMADISENGDIYV